MGDIGAVAGHGEGVAGEEGGALGVVRVPAPVPVGLVAGVVAFGAQRVFVVRDVVPVPGKEEGLEWVSGREMGEGERDGELTDPWFRGVCWT